MSFVPRILPAPSGRTSRLSQIALDDFTRPRSNRGTSWAPITDRAQGGQSDVRLLRVMGEDAGLWLNGTMRPMPGRRLGGQIGAVLPLKNLDASRHRAVRLVARGDGLPLMLQLSTTDTRHSWQGYRTSFAAGPSWTEVVLDFTQLVAWRTPSPFEPRALTALSVRGIGRQGPIELRVRTLEVIS